MSYEEAMKLLDRVKDGAQYPPEVVAEALAMTGDRRHATQVPYSDIAEFVQSLRQAGAL